MHQKIIYGTLSPFLSMDKGVAQAPHKAFCYTPPKVIKINSNWLELVLTNYV